MPFERDPLSRRYDNAARAMITRATEALTARPGAPWVRGIVDSPPGDPRETRGANLTAHQRAFQRALYYHPLIYHRSDSKAWSLKVEWEREGVRLGGPSRRIVRIRLFNDRSGSRHAEGARGSYVRNPALRSQAAVIRQS